MNIVTGEVGIDVSKAFLDVCIGDGKPFRVPYTEADCKELIRRLPKGSVVHLESSGGYERVVRTTLRTAGFDVKTHDPLKVRRHAQSQARKGKTDALDAKHLAANGSKIPSQQEKSLTREGLCDLSRAIDSLKGNIAKLRTQARAPGLDPYVQSQLLACAKSLATHVKAMEKEFGRRVKASDLKDKHTTAQTVPGCGPCLARVLVSELPENLGEFTLNQVSSYSAIAPIDDESGQTKKPARIQRGNVRIKAALYMPAIACIRGQKWANDLYARLRAKGRAHQQAIVAVMRRLLIRIVTVLQRGSPWVDEPNGG